MAIDIKKIREDFPSLSRKINNRPLIYLDNTATSQTPSIVLSEVDRMYCHAKANVHRGVHTLSQEATAAQEATREKIKDYINAESSDEIIFTRGTTEAINLVASSYGQLLNDDDEIILTVMEHHSNIVPWQLISAHKKIVIKVVPIDDRGVLDLDVYKSLFTDRTKMVAVCHVSNVLGTINPVKEMTEYAHSKGVPVLIDGAQAAPHLSIDVRDIGADFYAFSSHKMYGPTGVGVLYGRRQWLEAIPPYQGGGEMIAHVSFESTTFADLPFKFEAGTPDYVDIAAFNKAIDYIRETGIHNIAEHENKLTEYTTRRMTEEIEGLTIYGTAPHKSAVISFNVGNIHHYDIGMLLDKLGVAVRTGHHCAQPLMHRLGIEGCVRASFGVYNTEEEAEAFVKALKQVTDMLR